MQKSTTIGFIGAGNMAYALIYGLLNNGIKARNIKISDISKKLLSQRNKEFGVEVFTNNAKLVAKCDVVVLAVKPQVLSLICKVLAKKKFSHQPLIISIVAGVRVNDINNWLGGDNHIVRTMPNTPALLGKGATGMFSNAAVTDKQKTLAEQILGAVGICIWVEDETMLDALTALSGSGPAYFFLLIESMMNAGIALGLDAKSAQQFSIQTALGASMMMDNSEDSVNQLRLKVTSKNGTTQAAIDSLQAQDFETIVSRAMRTAFDRAREIGIELGDE